MKIFIFSSFFEMDFRGTINACISMLKKKNVNSEGIWIRDGVVLRDDDILYTTDTIVVIPKNYSKPVPERPSNTPIDPLEQNPQNNRHFLSFGIRLIFLLMIFMESMEQVAFCFALGFIGYFAHMNFHIVVHDRQPTTQLASIYNVVLSFLGTLIPGLMEIDPGRLLMELNNAQVAADRAQGLLE
eukprot:NODE_1_length_95616_cov_0.657642.p57 type:complete len:185 gc:universal NODE_1_length_95616_cov_0.657642:38681-38127(-)